LAVCACAAVSALLWSSCGASANLPNLGGLIWGGVLSTGTLSGFGYVQACAGPSPPAGVTVVRRPVHRHWRHSLRFTVSDQSVHALCPVLGSPGSPNANVLSPPLFRPGDDAYIGFSVFFPTGFPSICTPLVPRCFMQVMEIYGEPFGGSSPVSILVSGRRLFFNTHTSGAIWTSPTTIPVGRAWNDFVIHVHFDTRPNVGFVELWFNGRRRRFRTGSRRFHEATLAPGVNWDGLHADSLVLQQYRGPNPRMGTVTLYETGAKVGRSYAAVAP
jgi:hypothetical protein